MLSFLCKQTIFLFKVIVPCEVIEYLTVLYGSFNSWKIPRRKNYELPNLDFEHGI